MTIADHLSIGLKPAGIPEKRKQNQARRIAAMDTQ
jgi:hypothetical protein